MHKVNIKIIIALVIGIALLGIILLLLVLHKQPSVTNNPGVTNESVSVSFAKSEIAGSNQFSDDGKTSYTENLYTVTLHVSNPTNQTILFNTADVVFFDDAGSLYTPAENYSIYIQPTTTQQVALRFSLLRDAKILKYSYKGSPTQIITLQ